MADLTKCWDCGEVVSNSADRCPVCGASAPWRGGLQDLIDHLNRVLGTRIQLEESNWNIRVPKPPKFETEIDISWPVLEWWVTVRDAHGSEVWKDWVDYYDVHVPKRYENREQLAREMRQDIEDFVNRLAAADDFRVVLEHVFFRFLPFDEAEWRIDGLWQPVWPEADSNDDDYQLFFV